MVHKTDPEPCLPRVIPVRDLGRWLPAIFPEGIEQRNYVVREIAAKTVFVMLYTGAVEGSGVWLRPAQVTLMSSRQAAKTSDEQRLSWRRDSLAGGRLKPPVDRWYASNTRESIRDETLRSGLIPLGAVVVRAGVATTAGVPRYALSTHFVELLITLHKSPRDTAAIERWQDAHLSAEAVGRVRALARANTVASQRDMIRIAFPNGAVRLLPPGPSTAITKAVIEGFAVRFLDAPAVLLVSDSSEKVVVQDQVIAGQIGLRIESERNLPDVILFDTAAEREKLVFVEVVASDGAITAARRRALAGLAANAGFRDESVFFVTAFMDRTRPEFRRNVGEVAWNTLIWFVAEPDCIVEFRSDAQKKLNSLPV